MNKYGQTAVDAVKMYRQRRFDSPVSAWEHVAGIIFVGKKSSIAKACPKNAFLGLCEEGLVRGIPAGKYTRSRLNKDYALRAVKLLRKNPDLASDPKLLWRRVMDGEEKQHNGQMDVVVALWKAGLIDRHP